MKKLDEVTVMIKAVKPKKVFVVHGRDEALKQSVFEFLLSIGLKPTDFNEAMESMGKGSPYIGEVLTYAFENAQAIVVLLTGDDEARLRQNYRHLDDPDYEKELTPQPRPNVLLEAGMALGREEDRTVLVQVGNIKQMSDLLGRHILKLDNSEGKRRQFISKLKAARCEVNTAGNEWQKAGDFSVKRLTNVA